MVMKNQKVFIVDDDESVCRALKILLTTFDFEVKSFNSAESFFACVSNDDMGCLLIDIHMPGLDGWAAQKRLVDSGSKRPVIFISAEKPEIAAARALKVGALGFLKKPVDAQILVDLINSAAEAVEGATR